jgi:serine/threonine-protein kinase
VAPRVVARIAAALHPTFAALLAPEPGERRFRVMASAPAGAAPENLPADGRWAALVAVLGKPLDVADSDGGGLAGQLPAEDLALLRRARIEMLAPVTREGQRLDALLALGSKRSEEPYSQEDRDLLATIADGLALLAERPATPVAGIDTLAECPRCGACFDGTVAACPEDGSAPRSSRLPRVLAGRYRLDHRLGRGGMGTVYRALDTALDRQVAVKLVREDLAGHGDMAARFQQEARAVAAFAHPNVVTVHDFGIEGGAHAYLVMELLEGSTLRERLQRERMLAAPTVVGIMRGVTAAVEAAHRRQLVHRDLKPENVFLVRAGDAETAKILDFGIAKALRVPNGATTAADTQAGWLVGTPQYMAPEQLRGGEAGSAWDVWALAVMMYEMLVGRLPFSGFLIDAEPGGLPGGYRTMMLAPLAGAPETWRAFFTRALSHEPTERPATARALFGELERALHASD